MLCVLRFDWICCFKSHLVTLETLDMQEYYQNSCARKSNMPPPLVERGPTQHRC